MVPEIEHRNPIYFLLVLEKCAALEEDGSFLLLPKPTEWVLEETVAAWINRKPNSTVCIISYRTIIYIHKGPCEIELNLKKTDDKASWQPNGIYFIASDRRWKVFAEAPILVIKFCFMKRTFGVCSSYGYNFLSIM